MADGTKIEWTDATWNPITGCNVVSPGCTNCYAMKLAGGRLRHHPSRAGLTEASKSGPVWNGKVRLNADWLDQPLRWAKPRRVFVCAHGDLFHESVPDEWIDGVFAVMALAPQHQFQVLTKRPARMREYMASIDNNDGGRLHGFRHALVEGMAQKIHHERTGEDPSLWLAVHLPLSNIWLGVSVEDQERADERIPPLLETPAAVRFISAEPMLGPIDLLPWINRLDVATAGLLDDPLAATLLGSAMQNLEQFQAVSAPIHKELDWVIVGGESGPGARPTNLAWVRSIRDQCQVAGVPVFIKQLGRYAYETQPAEGRPQGADYALANLGAEHPQRKWFRGWTLIHNGDRSDWYRYFHGRDRKGGNPEEWPEDLRLHEWPEDKAETGG